MSVPLRSPPAGKPAVPVQAAGGHRAAAAIAPLLCRLAHSHLHVLLYSACRFNASAHSNSAQSASVQSAGAQSAGGSSFSGGSGYNTAPNFIKPSPGASPTRPQWPAPQSTSFGRPAAVQE